MSKIESIDGRLLMKDGKLIVSDGDGDCCCGGAPCCGRTLPETLYVTVYNIPVSIGTATSDCCSDGKTIELHLCQGTGDGSVPSIWISAANGEVWCDGTNRLWWIEVQCGNPIGADVTSSNLNLRYKVTGDDCTIVGMDFICLEIDGQEASLDSAASTCDPVHWEFREPNLLNCCDNPINIGEIVFIVTEDPP